MKKLILVALFTFYSSTAVPEINKILLESAYGVVTGTSINLRKEPDIKSEIVLNIPQGSVVKILEFDDKPTTIDEYKNYWCKVKYKDSIGWLFGGYIVLRDGPVANAVISMKTLPNVEWKDIYSVTHTFSKDDKFIENQQIPIYKSTEDVVNKKPFTSINEFRIFKVTDKFYNEKEYEDAAYSQFVHDKYGKVWISNGRFYCISDVKSYKTYQFILTTTEPIIEGDQNRYRLIIKNNNKIVYATNSFKDVGPYAGAYIKGFRLENNYLIITMFCKEIQASTNFINNSNIEYQYMYTYVKFNLETNKIESIYEYSMK